MDLELKPASNRNRLTVDVDDMIFSEVTRLQRKFRVPKTRVLRELLRIGINNSNASKNHRSHGG